jgi:transcriptional regulator with XRE-family HTH domain
MADYNTLTEEQAGAVRVNLRRFQKELSEAFGRDVSQEELADAAGIRLDTLRDYVHGRRSPKIAPLLKLAEVFGRPVGDFFLASPPPLDPTRIRRFFVRTKIIGTPPPGLEEEIQKVLARYTIEEAVERARLKNQMAPRKRASGESGKRKR